MLILFGLAFAFGGVAHAGVQVGTVTQVQGEVKLFTQPGKTIQGPPPHALYEGLYYSVRDAQVGDRLEKGNIIRTALGAKACVIYDNGDQFHVAPATAFAISWDKDEADGKAEMALSYGGARGVISKGGPRSHFTIRTRTAVMGVRGTDFFIGVDPATGATETATLRGSVAVASAAAPDSQPVEVKAGEAASVAAPPPPPSPDLYAAKEPENGQPAQPPAPAAPPVIEVRKASVQELGVIQKVSELKPEPAGAAAPPPETAKAIERLEAQAKVSTLNDIRLANPELAARLDKDPGAAQDIDAVNRASIAELVPTAPKTVASNSVIAEVGQAPAPPPPPAVSNTAVTAPEETRPESRTGGFRLLRGELTGIFVTQNGGNSQSVELQWTPRYQLGGWGWAGLKLGGSPLKGVNGTMAMLEQELVFGVRVYGPVSVEGFFGGQEWVSNGGGFEFGLNLEWFPERRHFGLVERWLAGFVHVNGSVDNSQSGVPAVGGDAEEFRLGVGL